jgi:MFS family permease
MSSPQAISIESVSKPIRSIDRRFVTAALMLVMVLASMEMTVTSTAMPTIIGELHGLEHYSWVASLYLLTCTVSMPLYGRLSDALGRKRVVLFAITLFTVASILASTSQSMIQLVLFRGLQGLGAGGIMPVVLTILADIFTLEERAKIQAFFSAVWGTASLAGPWLGATLVMSLGWRSIFWINLPFGVIAMAVLMWKYHDQERPHSSHLDLTGFATLAIGCTAVLALVSRLGPGGWSWGMTIGLLAVTAAATIYYFIHEKREEHPILPLDLVFSRTIGPCVIGAMLHGAGFLSLDTYVPLYVQGGLGGGAGAAASVVTPVMLTWAISGVISAPMVVRFGFRKTALVGAAIMAIGFAGLLLCAIFHLPRWSMTAVLAFTGFGLGPSSMSYLLAAQNSVTWQQRGVATGAIQFFRSIGGAVGIGVLGALFNVLIRDDFVKLESQGIKPSTLLDPHASGAISPEVLQHARHAIASGLMWVFAAMMVVAIIQFIVTAMMSSATPEKVDSTEVLEV